MQSQRHQKDSGGGGYPEGRRNLVTDAIECDLRMMGVRRKCKIGTPAG